MHEHTYTQSLGLTDSENTKKWLPWTVSKHCAVFNATAPRYDSQSHVWRVTSRNLALRGNSICQGILMKDGLEILRGSEASRMVPFGWFFWLALQMWYHTLIWLANGRASAGCPSLNSSNIVDSKCHQPCTQHNSKFVCPQKETKRPQATCRLTD